MRSQQGALLLSLGFCCSINVVCEEDISQLKTGPPRTRVQWYEQPINHFGTHKHTFQQRFLVDDTYARDGAALFFFCGNEGQNLLVVALALVFPHWKDPSMSLLTFHVGYLSLREI